MFDLERRREWVCLAVCLVVVLREALSVIRQLGWPGLGLDLLIVGPPP